MFFLSAPDKVRKLESTETFSVWIFSWDVLKSIHNINNRFKTKQDTILCFLIFSCRELHRMPESQIQIMYKWTQFTFMV